MTSIMTALASDEIMSHRSAMGGTIARNNDTTPSLTYIEITTTLAFTSGIIQVIVTQSHLFAIIVWSFGGLVNYFISLLLKSLLTIPVH